ncbi:MAG: beta-lactamase family protein, partial [Lachnospiraceae bacterium]|nr:beta-lactamase family protein [Lachnospiraceae bacterium]
LSENDTVSELLPGYTAYYDSEPCEITVGQLLYQTSGYTNKESDYPSATEEMSLRDWAYSMSGKELNSRPGSEYSYSNVNYDLLGAIIEQVSGKTYAEYMNSEILIPLGLTHTYAQVPEDGVKIVSGSRLGYRRSFTYEIPVIEGRIPAGYFYSNATDMAEWIRIWTGTADIPEEYKELISAVKDRLNEPGDYYSGWELFENGTIGHSGGTPNYSSRIVFSDEEKIGVCVLTNLNVAASTDGLCNAIFELAAGVEPGHINIPTDVWTVFDIIFTVISVVAILSIIVSLLLKRRGVIAVLGITLLVLLIAVCIVMPMVFGAGLGEIAFTWAPYSFAGGLILMEIGVVVAGVRFFLSEKKHAY